MTCNIVLWENSCKSFFFPPSNFITIIIIVIIFLASICKLQLMDNFHFFLHFFSITQNQIKPKSELWVIIFKISQWQLGPSSENSRDKVVLRCIFCPGNCQILTCSDSFYIYLHTCFIHIYPSVFFTRPRVIVQLIILLI